MTQPVTTPEWHVVVRPADHPRGLSELEQARAMGFCEECGPKQHTYTALCWWRALAPQGRQVVKLNLGAGNDRRKGFVSVDLRADVADVKASVDDLPYESGTVDELLALDVLEHFWRDDVPAVLAEWRRVLRPGSLLTVRVPNLLALSQQLVSAATTLTPNAVDAAGQLDNTIENIYGGHRWGPGGSWDAHHWGWTPTTFERDLQLAGFAVLSNDLRHNMTAVAQR